MTPGASTTMFKRTKAPPAPQETEQANLQKTFDTFRQEQAAKHQHLEDIIALYETIGPQIDTNLQDTLHRSDTLLRPVIQAMLALKTTSLAALPRLLLTKHPQSEEVFRRFFGNGPEEFLDPPMAAVELLTYRIHTINHLLSNLALRQNVSTDDVYYQANHDVTVVGNHEASRQAQKKAAEEQEARRTRFKGLPI